MRDRVPGRETAVVGAQSCLVEARVGSDGRS